MKFVHAFHTKCQGVRACEKVCSKTFFKKEDPAFSSIRIEPMGGQYEVSVCNQCGACMDICPVKALVRNKNGTVMVKKDICVGCFMCVGFCPTSSMRRAAGQREPFKCVSCGACIKACPHGALSMAEVVLPAEKAG